MNKAQKSFFLRLVVVISFTTLTVGIVAVLKSGVQKSEAITAMKDLGKRIRDYKDNVGLLPTESFIEEVQDELLGSERVGEIHYRKKWVRFSLSSDSVLAYTKKEFNNPFWKDGYVILRQSGHVQWLTQDEFKRAMLLEWGKDEPRH